MTYEERKKEAISLLTEAFWDREIFNRICLEKGLPIHDEDYELSATEKRIVEEHATSLLLMLEGMAPASVPGFWDAFKQAVDEVLESFFSKGHTAIRRRTFINDGRVGARGQGRLPSALPAKLAGLGPHGAPRQRVEWKDFRKSKRATRTPQ